MSERTAIKVWRMAEGDGYVVGRTEDEADARAAVLTWERTDRILGESRESVVLAVEGPLDQYAAEDLRYVEENLEMLRPRVGWYRWTPCHESSCYDGGGHSGHLGYADGPGRGVFRGVYLRS